MPDGSVTITKLCGRCREQKPVAAFSKRRGAHDGLQGWCKACAQSVKSDPEQRAVRRVYKKRHRRKRTEAYRAARKRQKVRYRKRYPLRSWLEKKRRDCRERGIPFDLDEAYVESLWTGYCPVFGTTIVRGAKPGDPAGAQLDRIIPARGYVKGNVVFMSARANRLKSNATSQELQQLASWYSSQILDSPLGGQ